MVQLEHNERATALLKKLAGQGRLPHAILVEGPAGTGKKTFAQMVAQAALCTGAEKPCGICEACRKVENKSHPDVCFYTVPEGKKEFPVEQVREIRGQAYVAPNEGACKIYVVDKAHAMNQSAQNALLKLIEEPPPFVCFILLCENRSKMLETILSRVTSIPLETPTVEQCAGTLQERFPEKEQSLLQAAAAGAAGNIGRALSLLDTAKPSKAAADAKAFMQALAAGERYECVRILAGYEKDPEGLSQMLPLLRERFANLCTAYCRGSRENLPGRQISPAQAARSAEAVDEAAGNLARNVRVPLLCACMVEEMMAALG